MSVCTNRRPHNFTKGIKKIVFSQDNPASLNQIDNLNGVDEIESEVHGDPIGKEKCKFADRRRTQIRKLLIKQFYFSNRS